MNDDAALACFPGHGDLRDGENLPLGELAPVCIAVSAACQRSIPVESVDS